MKNLISTLVFILIFAAVGAMAFAAAPRGDVAEESTAVQPGAPAADIATQQEVPDATTATANYNMIAMPLDASGSISPWNADGLADYIDASAVDRVLAWDASAGVYKSWYNNLGVGDEIPLSVGGVYFIRVNSTNPSLTTASFVGDVPAQGSVQFNLTYTGGSCTYNTVSIPLDRGDLATPGELAADMGGSSAVDRVLQWNATSQTWQTYYVSLGVGDFSSVQIGYPYFVCVKSSFTWPTYP